MPKKSSKWAARLAAAMAGMPPMLQIPGQPLPVVHHIYPGQPVGPSRPMPVQNVPRPAARPAPAPAAGLNVNQKRRVIEDSDDDIGDSLEDSHYARVTTGVWKRPQQEGTVQQQHVTKKEGPRQQVASSRRDWTAAAGPAAAARSRAPLHPPSIPPTPPLTPTALPTPFADRHRRVPGAGPHAAPQPGVRGSCPVLRQEPRRQLCRHPPRPRPAQ
jgi:hypothetical protein